jgi:hypothetical protein
MRELTPEEKAAYVKSPDHCPYCKSKAITGGTCSELRRMLACADCGCFWYDVLTVTGIDTIETE